MDVSGAACTGSGITGAGTDASRAGSDFLNHVDVFVDKTCPVSPASLVGVIFADLRPRSRNVLLLFGLSGSSASWK